MALTGKSPSETYKDILHVDNSNNGIDGSTRAVTTDGGDAALKIGSNGVGVTPNTANSERTLLVEQLDGTDILKVDTINAVVYGPNSKAMNTQYAYFSTYYGAQEDNIAGTHYPLFFTGGMFAYTSVVDQVNGFGTGTDPATTLTFADSADAKSAEYIAFFMYLPDAITIDAVYSLEGADAATGDTTRMHLMAYAFNSGDSAGLTSGTLLAHNADVTNAGSEQAYLTTWTVDSSTVSAGRVLVSTFESDSVNSNYSYQVIVKYHLT